MPRPAGQPLADPSRLDGAPPRDAAWAALPALGWPHRTLLRLRLAGGPPDHPGLAAVAPYDVLRTRSMQAMAAAGWSRIGVTGTGRGPAAPAVALNLALSVARRADQRVALVDLDLDRQPVLGLLGHALPPPNGVLHWSRARLGENLALASFTAPPGRSAETLLSAQFQARLAEMVESLAPDLTILHLPPILMADAGMAALDLAETVLLAVDGTSDTAARIRAAEGFVVARRPLLGLFLYDGEV